MQTDNPMKARKCGKRTRSGGSCGRWAMHGQNVCRMHGGKSPQALAKAEDRMRELVHPAVSRLAALIQKADSDAVRLNATRYVLDWAGFKPAVQLQGESEIVVRVVHEDQPLLTLDIPYAPRNGHSNGHTE